MPYLDPRQRAVIVLGGLVLFMILAFAILGAFNLVENEAVFQDFDFLTDILATVDTLDIIAGILLSFGPKSSHSSHLSGS